MAGDSEQSVQNKTFDGLAAVRERCPDCDVAIGEEHTDGCDVARCVVNGRQQLGCEANHDCGGDVWSGWWPGEVDCQRLGWMIGPGLPDLNRLYTEAVWDSQKRQWVKPT
ncbi:hypothetical protein F0L68_33330 [Solihabitans fulvus]|uniref:Uncharacterized protein n=1 Tax=Solihabitans fulvus TaxID=1892852 RepID=A0A5B2WRY5_9PSEU|nr:hypothetical protein [Solihabitans fulvus]KAA2253296.1 hypothetical protein F0L68_33330 [Solihabitans fulvus]